jgi:hypothetical protein
VAAQRTNRRRREDNVADQAQAHQKDLHIKLIYVSMVASSISITGMSSLIG